MDNFNMDIMLFSWFAEDTLDLKYQFENESKLCFIRSWRGKRSFWKNWPWIRCWKHNRREFWSISITTVLRSYSQLWSSLENGRYDTTCYWCDLTHREKSWTGNKTENFISVASWRCSRTVFHDLSHSSLILKLLEDFRKILWSFFEASKMTPTDKFRVRQLDRILEPSCSRRTQNLSVGVNLDASKNDHQWQFFENFQ